MYISKRILRDCIEAMETGIEYASYELAEHDRSLGRTIEKHQTHAEIIEGDIGKMRESVDALNKRLQQERDTLEQERDYARQQAQIERDKYCHPDHGGHLFAWECNQQQ